ncbi:sialin-like [Bacillus rossius redtenbacheri]|uniref:sialin-like n=1 Tax=Bacillus rossius redtenbacheri TaxID=93214 RepID=UPI002FDD2EC7
MNTKSNEQAAPAGCRSLHRPPARYVFCALAAAGNMLNFTLKASLSVAIVAMVDRQVDSGQGQLQPVNSTATPREGYDWDEMTQSYALAGLSYGSLLSCVLGARLAELLGPRLVSGPSLGVAALLHVLCPLAAGGGVGVFVAMRVLQGVFVGAYAPGVSTLLLRWVPLQERGLMVSIIFSATNVGILVSMALTGKICTVWGWPAVFYFYGGLGCLWTVLWLLFVYNTPGDHPRISAEENDYILANVAPESKVTFPVPWISICTSLPVWSFVAVKVGVVYLLYMFLNELPTYMKNILNFDLASSGYLSAVPYVFSLVTNLMLGSASQWLRSKGYLSHLTAYKIFNGLAMLGPAAMMLAITQVHDATAIVVLIVVTMVLQGGFFGGSVVNHLDLSPNFAATVTGLSEVVSEVVSILAPTLVGAIINGEQTRARWQIVFYTSSAIISLPYLIFFFFGSVEEQRWNRPKEEPEADKRNSKLSAA